MSKLVLALLAGLAVAKAQVYVTDPLGHGKNAVFVSGTALVAEDFTVLSSSTVQYWRGITDRIDVFGGPVITTALGQAQTGVIMGTNIGLFKTRFANASLLTTALVPVTRRKDADPLWAGGIVANRAVKKDGPAIYAAYNVTVPLGATNEKLFTPPYHIHNAAIGIAIPKGKFLVFIEYDFPIGRNRVGTGGGGAAYGF